MPQTVCVTAGASGIGRAIAERFHLAGANVFVCDVDERALADFATQNPGIFSQVVDVSCQKQVAAFFSSLPAGRQVDVLVNNAGIAGPRGTIEDISIEEWQQTLDVNLTGAFMCMQHVIRRMKAAGRGAIINIVTASVRTGLPSRSAYIASKAGLLALSHNAARELGPFGIRVNAVLPGFVDGPRARSVVRQVARDKGISEQAAIDEALRTISMRTMIQPEEIADMVFWLGSDQAIHVSGQAIGIDGNLEWES